MNTKGVARRPRHRWTAAVYDLLAKLSEKRVEPLRDLVAGGASGRVLEVDCGTGLNFAHYDWSKVASLEATEPDILMLRRAQARLSTRSSEPRARVELHDAPAEALPFADEEFDTVVATLVLCTVSDLDRSLSEIRRVLKVGGTYRMLEHVRADGKRARVQELIQPAYDWLAAGCQLTRRTQEAVRGAGMSLEIEQRTAFGPLWPAFIGVATKVG